MNIYSPGSQAGQCSHNAPGKVCPISKTPCLGECIYASILDDIGLGIIGLDISTRSVFFQNKLAVQLLKDTIKPKDYDALVALFIPNMQIPAQNSQFNEPRTMQYGKKFIGYSVYLISESYFWIYLNDITEKTRLNAIAEAVNTMNSLGYIFSGIRHELGNPINSIKTSLTVCRKNLQSYTKETISEFLDRMLTDINRVECLLRDLKNFSMYEHPECREVHVISFMENLLTLANRDFAGNNISIKTFFRPGTEYGYFDSRALQHVILNLLANASDALKEVVAPQILISTIRSGDRIIIRIKDNGSGIPEEQKKYLFQPFTTTKIHGTGLGLVIVKKMLLKMDGTIEIESREKVGTTVTLSLPVSRKTDE